MREGDFEVSSSDDGEKGGVGGYECAVLSKLSVRVGVRDSMDDFSTDGQSSSFADFREFTRHWKESAPST